MVMKCIFASAAPNSYHSGLGLTIDDQRQRVRELAFVIHISVIIRFSVHGL